MELTFGMALVIASRERLRFVDLAERPDHELMFINVDIVQHNIHIRHTIITFFYVRVETFCFDKRTDLYESSTVDFSKTYRTIPNLFYTEFPQQPKHEIWSFIAIFIV